MKGREAVLHDLWLLRHGETEWNAAGRLQGHGDSPLTARGRAQAEGARRLLEGVQAARIASPLGRAQATARIIFGDQPFATDHRLAEINVGAWSGRSFAEIRAELPQAFAGPRLGWYDHAPGGEGLVGLEARCRSLLADLEGPSILVTHGITLRMLRTLAGGADLHDDAEPFDQGAVHLIRGGRALLLA